MQAALLISFREVIEASLMLAVILSAIVKTGQLKQRQTVWRAAGLGFICCALLVAFSSFTGFRLEKIYVGKTEQITEGVLLIISVIFITLTVFFLHKYFSRISSVLLHKINQSIEGEEKTGLFLLVFTVVIREGIEIAVFLTSTYLISTPFQVVTGLLIGTSAAFVVAYILFNTTVRIPVRYTFYVINSLLILFGASLLIKSIHEFTEAGLLSGAFGIRIPFIPPENSTLGNIITSLTGFSQEMSWLQIATYLIYTVAIGWRVFKASTKNQVIK